MKFTMVKKAGRYLDTRLNRDLVKLRGDLFDLGEALERGDTGDESAVMHSLYALCELYWPGNSSFNNPDSISSRLARNAERIEAQNEGLAHIVSILAADVYGLLRTRHNLFTVYSDRFRVLNSAIQRGRPEAEIQSQRERVRDARDKITRKLFSVTNLIEQVLREEGEFRDQGPELHDPLGFEDLEL